MKSENVREEATEAEVVQVTPDKKTYQNDYGMSEQHVQNTTMVTLNLILI